jgi:hypothetical protein
MELVFLGAKLPLTKTFLIRNGQLASTPYPHVTRVTSYHEQAKTLEDFERLLRVHATARHCLFGGTLDHPLVDQSRAGKTLKASKEWVVFDFDKVDAKDHKEVVSKYLPAYCQQVSYIAQVSASMFRPDARKWSGHIFMLLDKPHDEQHIKQWFEHLNFSQPSLSDQISLSDSLQALHWPLDRTVAYNSKLIYIAPPICHGFEPSVKHPIVLVKKKTPKLTIPAFPPIDSAAIRSRINDLRAAISLPSLDYVTKLFDGHEVLQNTEAVEIHGIKTSGNHYIRFNLNGGDSYAYFIDLRNPGVIRNFKGEPFLQTKDAAPDLYKSLAARAPRITSKPPLDDETEVLAFYATNQNSKIKIGTFAPGEHRLVLNNATETSAKAWLQEYGLVQKSLLPHISLGFDPTSEVQYVPGATEINCFTPTVYMRMKPKAKSTFDSVPPTIKRLIISMMGDPMPNVLDHFMNWLAYIFKTRKKTAVSWVMHGTQGTGKGTFVKYILTPLFGKDQVRVQQFSALEKEFNGFLETALFVVFEDADMRAVESSAALDAKLRHWIGDSPVEIRRMGTDHYSVDNYTNFFFFSNEHTPVRIAPNDRRFNVGERQDTRLFLTPNELNTLVNGEELEAFAQVLHDWPVDEMAAHMLIETEARATIQEASSSVNQQVANAILLGDLQFFYDRMPSEMEAAADFHNRFNPMGLYRDTLEKLRTAAASGQPVLMTDELVFPLFRTLIPDTRYFQDSKTWRRRHYATLGIDLNKQFRDPADYTKRKRGLFVQWQMPDDGVVAMETATVKSIAKQRAKKTARKK